VPILDMSEEWLDANLSEKYGLTEEEDAFISSKIRPFSNE